MSVTFITLGVDFVTEECCNCHIAFAMPKWLQQAALDDTNKWFYCPNGHGQQRVANGVCPCCHRSFGDLHQHMQTEHPEFCSPDEKALE